MHCWRFKTLKFLARKIIGNVCHDHCLNTWQNMMPWSWRGRKQQFTSPLTALISTLASPVIFRLVGIQLRFCFSLQFSGIKQVSLPLSNNTLTSIERFCESWTWTSAVINKMREVIVRLVLTLVVIKTFWGGASLCLVFSPNWLWSLVSWLVFALLVSIGSLKWRSVWYVWWQIVQLLFLNSPACWCGAIQAMMVSFNHYKSLTGSGTSTFLTRIHRVSFAFQTCNLLPWCIKLSKLRWFGDRTYKSGCVCFGESGFGWLQSLPLLRRNESFQKG